MAAGGRAYAAPDHPAAPRLHASLSLLPPPASYKQQAAAKAAELAAAAPADGDATAGDDEAAPEAPKTGPAFPLSVVRRSMLLDPEVGRVSAGAGRAVAAAAELFVGALADAAAAVVAEAGGGGVDGKG